MAAGQISKITVTGGGSAGEYTGAHLDEGRRAHLRALAEKLIQSHDHGNQFPFNTVGDVVQQFVREGITNVSIDFD